jgi:choline-sulfatase
VWIPLSKLLSNSMHNGERYRPYFCFFRLLLLWALSLLGACSRPPDQTSKSASRPPGQKLNILLITIDTLRADYLSCYGTTKLSTPNLDQLAARGVRFDQAFAQAPLTPPSHASILTGTYPPVHQVRDIDGFALNRKVPTLATLTHEAGLDTAAIVAAAVLNHRYGLNAGFDTYNDDLGLEKGAGRLPGVVAEIPAEMVTQRALRWLESRDHPGAQGEQRKNFFLWVHYFDPHYPHDSPEPFRSRYVTNPYAGEVAYVDEQIGYLMKGLIEKKLRDQTLVVLLSDHGESLGEHGEYTHGVFLYDSTMHIPLILAGPGIPAGKVISQQVRSIDVMPTIVDFLGLSQGRSVQGISLLPAILDGKAVRTHYSYMETLYPKTHLGWSELHGMRTESWKLIVAPKAELYQVKEDGRESRNVVRQYPEDSDRLQKQVWEIAGPPGDQTKPARTINEETRKELQSLGYASGGVLRNLRFDMSGPDPKDRVHLLGVIGRADELMTQNRFREAVSLLQKILQQDPTNPLIYEHLGVCYQQLGELRKAAQIYHQAIQNKADTDQIYAELGTTCVQLGDRAHGIQSMEQAAHMNPADLRNLGNLATGYLELGRPQETERLVREILKQNDRDAVANNLLGFLEIQRGQPELARKYFEKAIESDPAMAQPYLNLGILTRDRGQAALAISYFKKFLEKCSSEENRRFGSEVKTTIAELQKQLSSLRPDDR